MAEQGLLGAFAGHAFLRGLTEPHLYSLASGAKPFSAAPGQYLAWEGKPADAFYLIQSGHVALGSHVPGKGFVPLQTVGPGEVVGWSWLLPPHQWQFDCQAVDTVQGLALDGQWLRDLCENDHELAYRLLKQLLGVVAGRLAATRMRLRELQLRAAEKET